MNVNQFLFAEQLHFEDIDEYIQYIYNTCMANGQITETVELIRKQPKAKPFDYDFNTQEGKQMQFNLVVVGQSYQVYL